jgi:uncharacterized protein YigA (DUF484 family)
MSIQKKPEYSSDEISEKDVVAFLEQNPDFFARHENTLLKLKISHASGDAVSILEFQTDRLRTQNITLQEKLRNLVSVARENDRLNERIHRLTLALIDSASIDDIIDILSKLYKKEFHADWAHVYLFRQDNLQSPKHPHCIIDLDEHITSQFENFFKANRPLCGRLKKQQLEILFGEQADLVGSAVLMPLGSHGKLGMMTIGSKDSQRFHSSMGTIYLHQMSEIITHAFTRLM